MPPTPHECLAYYAKSCSSFACMMRQQNPAIEYVSVGTMEE
jgi:hypothetical protein